MNRRAWLLPLIVASLAMASCGNRDLTAAKAAALLRASADFTTRPGSDMRRELVEVIAVRRIGHSSTEVEFQWKDQPAPAGQPLAPVRTSLALFRIGETDWELASLYKVD